MSEPSAESTRLARVRATHFALSCDEPRLGRRGGIGVSFFLAVVLALGALALVSVAGALPSPNAASPRPVWVGTRATVSERTVAEVYRSTDGSEHWLPASKGLPGNALVIALAGSRQLAYAVMGPSACPGKTRGVYRTTDGGKTWTRKSAGLPPGVGPIAVDPARPRFVFASLFGACADRLFGFFRSRDGGEHWARLSRSFSDAHGGRLPTVFSRIVVSPRSPGVLYGTVGLVAKSTDGGRTWHETFRAPGDFSVDALTIDPRHPQVLYAGGNGGRVYRTADAGRTWVTMRKGIPSLGQVEGLAFDAKSGVVYAAVFIRSFYVYRSTNGGRTWVGKRLNGLGAVPTPLEADRSAPGIAYVRTSAGVFKTSNGGAGWVPKNEGLPREEVAPIPRLWQWRSARDAAGWSFDLRFTRDVAHPGPLTLAYLSSEIPCAGGPGGAKRFSPLMIGVAANGAFSYAGHALDGWPGVELTLAGRIASRGIRGTVRIAGTGPASCPGEIDSGTRSFVARCFSGCGPPPQGRLAEITAMAVG